MNKALYPGSFDPITVGHLDIITRASKIFDEIIIAIMVNPHKNYYFTQDDRIKMIQDSIVQLDNVKVIIGSGLSVDVAVLHDCNSMIRGIRNNNDFDNEMILNHYNKALNNQIETVFMITDPKYSFISSSGVKDILKNNKSIKEFVPKEAFDLIEKLNK